MTETTLTRPPAAPKAVPAPNASTNIPQAAAAPATGPGTSNASSLPRLRANSTIIRARAKDIRDASNAPIWTVWHVQAPADHSAETCLTPYYLWNRHEDFKPGHRVEIRHALNHYLIEMLILAVDKATQSITFQLLNVHDLTKLPIITGDLTGAVIMESGGNWVVQRGSVCLSPLGFRNKAEAMAWLTETQERIDKLKARGAQAA